jgi:hypothetical protein
MPNGKPGDHPITDMLVHGKHPFPDDMEEMIRKLYAVDSSILNDLGWEPFDWAAGKNLETLSQTITIDLPPPPWALHYERTRLLGRSHLQWTS